MKLPVETMLSTIAPEHRDMIRGAFTNRGLSKDEKQAGIGKLRASKPHKKVTTFEQGCSNFIWRWIAFDMGTRPEMPCTDEFEVFDALDARYGKADSDGRTERYELMRELIAELQAIQSAFMRYIPVKLQAGVMRWGRALGMVR